MGTHTTSASSCQLTPTGEQMKVWGHVNPPSELPVKCFYTVQDRPGVNRPSEHSSPVSVFVLDNLQKPMVSVHHDQTNKLFDIVCEIPKQSWNVTGCQLYTGHGENFYLTAKIQKASGNCHFYSVDENDLFRRLQSVGSREVSCDYTVNTEPSSLSPRSDPKPIPGYQPLTKNTPLTSEAGLRSQSTSVNLKATTRGDAHTVTVSPGSTLHRTPKYTMDASVSRGTVLILVVTSLCIGLAGVSAFCLIWTCRKHKQQSSKGTLGRTRQKNHPDIMLAHSTITTVNDPAGTYSMITSTPMTVAPDADKREDIFSEQDDANQYHVYNSISDAPSISNQGDPTYSLV